MDGQPRRLDSWKEIAEYLGRDVRTAMRWAKSQQLPVRRVGGQGRSVFAFTDEIDAWLAGSPAAAPDQPPAPSADPDAAPPAPPRRGLRYRAYAIAMVAVAVLVIAISPGTRWSVKPGASGLPVRVEVNELAVSLTDGSRRREIHRFDPDVTPTLTPAVPRLHDADGDGTRDVLLGISTYVDLHHRAARTGELINISGDGDVRWRFTFDDVLTFREERFDGPWGLTDWSLSPGSAPARIAIAAHHHTWWASMASVLDHRGQRLRTFVHPGWIESLLWLDEGRVALAGFTNARDAAMLAVVDVEQPDARAPGTEGTPFECLSCATGTPAFYATFGRSELNSVHGGRFNRARVSRQNGRIVVRTVEVAGDPLSATAIYEFDSALRLLRARYDDLYWTMHARFEREGRVTHTRETCPERDGPADVHVWSDAGWRRVTTAR